MQHQENTIPVRLWEDIDLGDEIQPEAEEWGEDSGVVAEWVHKAGERAADEFEIETDSPSN